MPGKLFGYGAIKQLKDMIPVFFATGLMAVSVYVSISFTESLILKLILGSLVGIIIYGIISHFLKIEGTKEIKNVLKSLLQKTEKNHVNRKKRRKLMPIYQTVENEGIFNYTSSDKIIFE